jgi:hypothetical protein
MMSLKKRGGCMDEDFFMELELNKQIHETKERKVNFEVKVLKFNMASPETKDVVKIKTNHITIIHTGAGNKLGVCFDNCKKEMEPYFCEDYVLDFKLKIFMDGEECKYNLISYKFFSKNVFKNPLTNFVLSLETTKKEYMKGYIKKAYFVPIKRDGDISISDIASSTSISNPDYITCKDIQSIQGFSKEMLALEISKMMAFSQETNVLISQYGISLKSLPLDVVQVDIYIFMDMGKKLKLSPFKYKVNNDLKDISNPSTNLMLLGSLKKLDGDGWIYDEAETFFKGYNYIPKFLQDKYSNNMLKDWNLFEHKQDELPKFQDLNAELVDFYKEPL